MNFMRLKSLLKYVGVPEVININGKRTHKTFSLGFPGGDVYLHPEGIERVVDAYFLIPRRIGGSWVRGHQRVLQVCRHKLSASTEGTLPYEVWDNKTFWVQGNKAVCF